MPTDDFWGGVPSRIELTARFHAEALAGLESFSHLEVVFLLDRVDAHRVETRARHPRGRTDWPRVGIFAQRAKRRPNRLGVSRCRIARVEGRTVHVLDLDAIDGTPVLDLKPYVREMAPRGAVRQPEWITELMRDYYAIERDSPPSGSPPSGSSPSGSSPSGSPPSDSGKIAPDDPPAEGAAAP